MTTDVKPEPTEEERQAAAIAVAEASRAKPIETPADAIVPPVAPKPDGVPDKFYDAKTGVVDFKAWGESHTSLETEFHKSRQQDAPPDDESQAAADGKPAGEAGTQAEAVSKAEAEFAEKGALSDETYKTLEKAGYTKAMVDNYIAGQTAASNAITTAAHTAVGGEEKYMAMLEWAGENLSAAEAKIFNDHVASADAEVVKSAVTSLYAKYEKNANVEGERVGGNAPDASSTMFANKSEYSAAMNAKSESVPGKTKYETDATYRAEVQKKMLASRAAGINVFH